MVSACQEISYQVSGIRSQQATSDKIIPFKENTIHITNNQQPATNSQQPTTLNYELRTKN